MKSILYEINALKNFLCRAESWVIIFFFIAVAIIAALIFTFGIDFKNPVRLLCKDANQFALLMSLMSGFLFIATSVPAIGAVIQLIDRYKKRLSINYYELWLPLVATALGITTVTIQAISCH